MKLFVIFFLFLQWDQSLSQTQEDYCNLSPEHDLCKNPPVGTACGDQYIQVIPSADDISQILSYNNDIRQRCAAGLENNALNGTETLPAAGNMRLMEWDDELARIAQSHADQCVYEHDDYINRNVIDGRYPAVGQNIAISFYSIPFPEYDFVSLYSIFYDGEVNYFKTEYVDSYVFDPQCGHYSQVIWANTYAVGCGASSYFEDGWYKFFVVCNYGPAGNFLNQPVYLSGAGCSQCPDDTTCDATRTSLCA